LSDNGTNQLGQVAGCVDASVTQNVFAGGGAMKLINCLPATMTRNLLVGGWEPSNLPALFPENTYETGLPGEATILVRPNEYESGRALVTVFNWRLNGEITADLSSAGFRAGDRYEVYDVQNYFGGPVRSGVLTDATVRLPMTGLGVAPPVGGAPVPPRHTAPEFAAFVVVKR
jgi:hypothetical protein